MEETGIDPTVKEQVKCLLRRTEYLDPLLEKSYKAVKMRDTAVSIEDFKLFLKHFSEQCQVPIPSSHYVATFVETLKSQYYISEEEFVNFFKDYLASLLLQDKKE